MKIKIAFDIDDTIVDLTSVLDIWFRKKHDISILGREIYDMTEYTGLDRNIIEQACHWAYDNNNLIEFYYDASCLMELLYQRTGEPIQFVTGRPYTFATQTYQLLKREIEVPFQIAFCDNWNSNKINFLKGYTFFYEDRKETALDLAENNIIVFMPPHTYNQFDNKQANIVPSMTISHLIETIEHLIEE